MNHLVLLSRLGAGSAVAVLALSALPSLDGTAPSGLAQQTASQAAFLTRTGSAPIASSLASASSFVPLPNSVMPNTQNQQCSVQSTDPGNPPHCSAAVSGGSVQKCSAHIDSQQKCSAFFAPGGTKSVCSTLGGAGPQCSVLQPAVTGQGPSSCSAFGSTTGGLTMCSVLASGGKQFCSVENPARHTGNTCSTFGGGPGGGKHWCSALLGGNSRKNFCSTVNAAPSGTNTGLCSAHTAGSACSIRQGQKGQCTSLLNAPQGSCSAFVAGAHCSVIGGNPGTTVCP